MFKDTNNLTLSENIDNMVYDGIGFNGIRYIQESGQKVQGKIYLDKTQPGLWYCLNTNTSINNTSDFTRADSTALLDKLQNLGSGVWIMINMDSPSDNKIQYFGNGSNFISVSIINNILGVNVDITDGIYDISISACNGPTESSVVGNNRLLIVSNLINSGSLNSTEIIDRYKMHAGGDDSSTYAGTIVTGKFNGYIKRYHGSSSIENGGSMSITIFKRF